MTTLLDLCELIVDCEHKTAPLADSGYPSIRTPNVGRGRLILNGVNRVSEETYLAWSRRATPQQDDLIIAREAPLGNVAIIPKGLKVCLGQRTVLVRPDKQKVDPRYLCYFLLGDYAQNRFHGAASGATVPHLNMKDIRGLLIPELPPIQKQRRIASILSAYDDLIENNTRRIAILEETARRIYEEWFVHFRFPGHEQVRMVESELGLMPEGWSASSVGDYLQIDKGLSYKGSGLGEVGVPMVNLKNFSPNGGFRRDATKPYSGEFKERHVIRAGDIVIANTDLTQAGTIVGSPALVPKLENEIGIFSHHLYAVRLGVEKPRALYWYHLLATRDFKSFARGYASGTTVLGLPKEGVLNYRLAIPPNELRKRFVSIVEAQHALVENLHSKSEKLRTTRDLLLPKLITGELDVSTLPEAEEAIAA